VSYVYILHSKGIHYSLHQFCQCVFHRDENYNLVFKTNMNGNFPMSVSVKLVSQVVENGAVFGGAVIVGLYILIIFEVRLCFIVYLIFMQCNHLM